MDMRVAAIDVMWYIYIIDISSVSHFECFNFKCVNWSRFPFAGSYHALSYLLISSIYLVGIFFIYLSDISIPNMYQSCDACDFIMGSCICHISMMTNCFLDK